MQLVLGTNPDVNLDVNLDVSFSLPHTSLKILGSLKTRAGTSLAVQWLRLSASTAGGTGSIPIQVGMGGGELRSCMLRGVAKNKNRGCSKQKGLREHQEANRLHENGDTKPGKRTGRRASTTKWIGHLRNIGSPPAMHQALCWTLGSGYTMNECGPLHMEHTG